MGLFAIILKEKVNVLIGLPLNAVIALGAAISLFATLAAAEKFPNLDIFGISFCIQGIEKI